jgi:hypothetical protein
MNALFQPSYTNDVSPEFLSRLNNSPFTEEQLARFDDEVIDQKVPAAQKSDYVVYADGSTAQIVTGAGQGNSDLALVGSRLCNGDEIINTLQGGYLFIAREGVTIAEDFLPSTKEEEIR